MSVYTYNGKFVNSAGSDQYLRVYRYDVSAGGEVTGIIDIRADYEPATITLWAYRDGAWRWVEPSQDDILGTLAALGRAGVDTHVWLPLISGGVHG